MRVRHAMDWRRYVYGIKERIRDVKFFSRISDQRRFHMILEEFYRFGIFSISFFNKWHTKWNDHRCDR